MPPSAGKKAGSKIGLPPSAGAGAGRGRCARLVVAPPYRVANWVYPERRSTRNQPFGQGGQQEGAVAEAGVVVVVPAGAGAGQQRGGGYQG